MYLSIILPIILTAVDVKYPVGNAPGSVEIADLNNDGKYDLVVANEQSDNISILLGDGRGGFVQVHGSPTPAGPNPNDIAIGDFNSDNKLDIAIANHEEKYLTVLLGDGKGGFTPAPDSPVPVAVKPHVHGLGAGDLNGDGFLDLVTDSWGDDEVVALFGNGKGGFVTSGKHIKVGRRPYQRLRVADVNQDGRADIVTTNGEGNDCTVILSDSKNEFRASSGSPFPCGDGPFNLAIGDVNGDGKVDLAIVNSPTSMAEGRGRDGLSVLLGNGKGGFNMLVGSPFVTGNTPNRIALGDISGDGIADIAVTSPDENIVTLFLMGSKGAMATSRAIAIGGRPKGVAIHDLDNDGVADLVVTNNSENAVTVILSK